MRREIPAWLFVAVVVLVIAVVAGLIWWRTGTQRVVIPPEVEQEWKSKLQKGYKMPTPKPPTGVGPYRPPQGATVTPGR